MTGGAVTGIVVAGGAVTGGALAGGFPVVREEAGEVVTVSPRPHVMSCLEHCLEHCQPANQLTP